MKSRGLIFLLATLGVATIVGCDNGLNSAKATLEVVINTPSGITFTPSVRVTGPGTDQALSASTTLKDRTPGNYVLKPQSVTEGDYTYGAANQNLELKSGDSKTATVEYIAQTGKLSVDVSVVPDTTGIGVEVRKGSTVLSVITKKGQQSFSDLEPGDYQLVVTATPVNYQAVPAETQTFKVEAGKSTAASVAFGKNFGSAAITINAPTGITPNVTLTGPGTNKALNTTGLTTLNGLLEGTYTLTVTKVLSGGIDYGAPSQTFSITKGETASSSLTYTATNSVIVVNVSGMTTNSAVSVSLQPQPDGTTAKTRNGNGEVRFEQIPFGSYTVSALAGSAGNYIDQPFGYGPSSAQTTSAGNPTRTFSAALAPLGQPGRAFFAGNGSLSNGGWSTSNSGQPIQYPPLATSSIDRSFFINDGSIALGTATLASALKSISTASPDATIPDPLPTEGLFRVRFDPSGNLYAIYQFVANPAGGSPLSYNRIVRISKANLEAGHLAPGYSGNKEIGSDALTITRVSGTPSVTTYLANTSDIAFDAAGNLWFANQAGAAIACIGVGQLSGGSALITRPNRIYLGNATGTGSRTYLDNVWALAFQGNDLWMAGGRYINEGGTVNDNARVSRLSAPTCPNTPLAGPVENYKDQATLVTPAVRLSISLGTAADVPPVYQPRGMTVSPDGTALWIADYGGGSDIFPISTTKDICPQGTIDTNGGRESVIKVPLNSANTAANTGVGWLRDAQVSSRITVGATDTRDLQKGMQQATDVGFDSRGNLWVSTNNNVEIDPTNWCFYNNNVDDPTHPTITVLKFANQAAFPATGITGTIYVAQDTNNPYRWNGTAYVAASYHTGIADSAGPTFKGNIVNIATDQRGKIYIVAASDLVDRNTTMNAITPLVTINAPSAGVGFTGLAINKPTP